MGLSTLEDIAYVAGILDGEGCLSLCPNGHQQPDKFCEQIRVSNTDKKLIDWLLKTFGGKHLKRSNSLKGKEKPVYNWALYGEKATSFLLIVAPYLKLKKERADILIIHRNLKSPYRFKHNLLPQGVIREIRRLKQEITILNKRGIDN